MRDLYKQLGVSDTAGEAEIRAALGGAGGEVRDAGEFILLDRTRRDVYDRNRRVLVTVGRLRAHLGLNLTRFWPRSRFADFTVDLSPLPRDGGANPGDPMKMAWAFGVEPPGRRTLLPPGRRTVAIVAVLALAIVLALALWYWM
jgi:hypothetical protein